MGRKGDRGPKGSKLRPFLGHKDLGPDIVKSLSKFEVCVEDCVWCIRRSRYGETCGLPETRKIP